LANTIWIDDKEPGGVRNETPRLTRLHGLDVSDGRRTYEWTRTSRRQVGNAPPDHVVAGFANRRYRFDLSHEGTDFLDRDIL
jgi:hypothetical protein